MAAEDGGVTDGRTNLIPNVVKDGSWHQHAGKHTEPSLFSLIAGLKGLAEVNQNEPTLATLSALGGVLCFPNLNAIQISSQVRQNHFTVLVCQSATY